MLWTSYNGWDWNIANTLGYFAINVLSKSFISSTSREKWNWNAGVGIYKTLYELLIMAETEI